jgi:hypothetical protein
MVRREEVTYPKNEDPMTPGAEFSLDLTLFGEKNRTGA